jgi:hypothetical protein
MILKLIIVGISLEMALIAANSDPYIAAALVITALLVKE